MTTAALAIIGFFVFAAAPGIQGSTARRVKIVKDVPYVAGAHHPANKDKLDL